MSAQPTVYGMAFSVYVQAVRLTLAEKGVPHDLVEVNPFAPEGVPDWYGALHPFGKMPAFAHGDVRLFESEAIARYVDEAFSGPALQPADPAARAKMAEVISVMRAYAYPNWVWTIFIERVSKPRKGGQCDEARVAKALPEAVKIARVLTELMGSAPWLAGTREPTLADFFAAPMMNCLSGTPEWGPIVEAQPKLLAWWERMRARPSAALHLI